MSTLNRSVLEPYTAPEWANQLGEYTPTHRANLIMKPTPVETWKLPGVDSAKYSIMIKRDDLTGCSLTGNKTRKLEFLLAEAMQKGCKHVMTYGTVQSNHCRSTAVACAQLGLKCSLYIHSADADPNASDGNMFMDRMAGASIYVVKNTGSYLEDMSEGFAMITQKAASIKAETGEESYVLPRGGSNELGVWGYLQAFQEIYEQVGDTVTDIVSASSSGGTSAGLAIANYLKGSPYRIHGICACDDEKKCREQIDDIICKLGLSVTSKDLIEIHDSYVGEGYGISSHKQQEFICNVAKTTGIFLDACYSGKAAYGLADLLSSDSSTFKGANILFIHTGGLLMMHANPIRDQLYAVAKELNQQQSS